MTNMAIMCECVEVSLLGCVEQSVVQIVPSVTRFLPDSKVKSTVWSWYLLEMPLLADKVQAAK